MKKIMTVLTMIMVLLPAALFLCHCCPAMAQEDVLKIESPDCRGCCPAAFETVKDYAVIKNQPSHSLQSKVLDFFTGALIKTKAPVILIKTALALPGEEPPPPSPLVLSSILRI